MSGHIPWSEIRDQVAAEPGAEERIAEYREEALAEIEAAAAVPLWREHFMASRAMALGDLNGLDLIAGAKERMDAASVEELRLTVMALGSVAVACTQAAAVTDDLLPGFLDLIQEKVEFITQVIGMYGVAPVEQA